MAQIRPYEGENHPQILFGVREFLKALNSCDEKPIEKLTLQEARKALADIQKTVKVDYSSISETKRMTDDNVNNLKIYIMKPVAACPNAPVFVYICGCGWVILLTGNW